MNEPRFCKQSFELKEVMREKARYKRGNTTENEKEIKNENGTG